MDFDLTPEQQDIQRLARDFADRRGVGPWPRSSTAPQSFPYEIVEKLGGLGLMGIPFPQEYGGGGADNLSYALVVEELARVDSPRGDHDRRPHEPRHLADLRLRLGGAEAGMDAAAHAAGSGSAAFGLTEPEAGSDAGNTRTRARP